MRATTSALWARRPELADEINNTHRNPEYLGDVELPKSIRATSDAGEALARRVHGAACGAVADASGQSRPTGPDCSATTSRWSAWPRASSWTR